MKTDFDEVKVVSCFSEYLRSGRNVVLFEKSELEKRVIVHLHSSFFGSLEGDEKACFDSLSQAHMNLYLGSRPFWMTGGDGEYRIELLKECGDDAKLWGERRVLFKLSDAEVAQAAKAFAEELYRVVNPEAISKNRISGPSRTVQFLSSLRRFWKGPL